MERSIMTRFLLLLLFTTTSAFAPTRQHQHGQPSMLAKPQAAPSLLSLNSASFDDYSQTEPTQWLAYQDTLVGTGDVAQEGKVVTVAYKGTLMSNGKKFDEGPGISFRLGEGRVIAGWEQGIAGMKVGGKRVLKIPPQLAYGERGAGADIPPGAHLVFECELKGVAGSELEESFAEVSMNPLKILAFVLVISNFVYVAVHH
eukprot:CAMPEP_0201870610 /NCGR_PEP_ID=MMETSP0902-20130614/3690_1 /ASSEMBLY_ACC=CAM_ASM_000551 /TAXON_ID=420261 /ORGANISM="Thalassiosira antarctica, Strain CCMP982" /LENGTH=200 /DNA_ID=CAMNT_0048396295 /DNA_START=132 /DNA_END=734 /DNA_ORIENTATION=-